VTEVSVGELHDAAVEILGGLHAGEQVAGKGAILLKPYIIQAVQTRSSTHVLQTASSGGGGR
jgi:hypothetical protein